MSTADRANIYQEETDQARVNSYASVGPARQNQWMEHLENLRQQVPGMMITSDKLEEGGTAVEDSLTRINCQYQSLYFISAAYASTWGTLAAIKALTRFDLMLFANALLLVFLGFVGSLSDLPGTPAWAALYRISVRKYLRVFTRITGRAFLHLFLGFYSWIIFRCNSANAGGTILSHFLNLIASVTMVGAGVIGLLVAWRKSARLDRVKNDVIAFAKFNPKSVYLTYASSNPKHGMDMAEFNRMAAELSGGNVALDTSELGIIFNALDEHLKNAINEAEFMQWTNSSFVLL